MKTEEGLYEVMTIGDDVEGQAQLKILLVDDSTRSKLTQIRGNLYADNPRLRKMAAMPTMQQPQIDPERQAYLDAAYQRYLAGQAAAAATTSPATQPQPLTFAEKLQHDWKHSPAIRKEFVSFASYAAYCKAVEAGRCKVYGGV